MPYTIVKNNLDKILSWFRELHMLQGGVHPELLLRPGWCIGTVWSEVTLINMLAVSSEDLDHEIPLEWTAVYNSVSDDERKIMGIDPSFDPAEMFAKRYPGIVWI